jgi:thioredoxin-related protein
MLGGIPKKIELVANVAIIAVSCLLATVLVKNYLFTKPALNQSTRPTASQNPANLSVSSLDINWKQDKQTLILAVSSSCHFCSASAPFYKRLFENRKGTRLIAVFPQPVNEGQDYLKQLGVAVDEVRNSDFVAMGVQGTPTLLLVDSAGVLKNSWVGKLSSEQEIDVLNAVRALGD